MFSLEIKSFKAGFFDFQELNKAIIKGRMHGLSKAGAFIRQRAKSLIRKAPYATRQQRGKKRTDARRASSDPGKPPYNQTGHLRNWILFAYDRASDTVVVGPARLSRRGDAPNILEFGGSVMTAQGRDARIEPRPYMGPALQMEIDDGRAVAAFAGVVRA